MSKVLCFGSLNIDYVYGVDHIVQKGETISSENLNVYSGGKGLNQSVALGKARCKTYHAGLIGEDGRFLLQVLKESGVDTSFVEISEKDRTGNAIIQTDKNGENCIILYPGTNRCITRDMVDRVLSQFTAGDYLILQNEINELEYLIRQAHDKKMITVLNPSPLDDYLTKSVFECADWIILNEIEAAQITGCKSENQTELNDALRQSFPNAQIVLTRGSEGSFYIGKREVLHQDIFKVKAVDTTAAGDTFTGYFIAGLINGMEIQKALKLASKAASIAVSKKGAAPSIPFMDEVAL